MITVNAIGDSCPIPVVKTLNAIRELKAPDVIETLVDNEIAVQNLTRMADQKGYAVRSEKLADKEFKVTITVGDVQRNQSVDTDNVSCILPPAGRKNTVVVISSNGFITASRNRSMIRLYCSRVRSESPSVFLITRNALYPSG